MTDTFSTARLNVAVDTRQFSRDIRTVSSETERALANMKLSADAFDSKWQDLTAGIKDTRRIISGILISQGFYVISNALVEASAAAIQFSANMETAAISMEYFVEGANKAAKAAAYLRSMNEFAARTPFTTEGTLALSKYMQAVGVSMNTTKSFLGVITDTAAATGATEENLQRIVFGLGQMMTKGRLANEEIRQLANANVPIYEILQEELGLTGEQISNIGNNWVKADTAVVAILRGLEKRYDGAADRISDTVTGMTDTIKDDAKILAQVMTSGIYNNVSDRMATIRDSLDKYREVATTQGSMGLFDQLLREADASGEVGTMILNVIGNTNQLIDALHRTYIAATPLIGLFGKSMYTSLSVVEITLTSFSQIVNGTIDGLNKLGITTGTTSEVMASLFIAYKASKWMGLLGQGAVNAAYSLYQTTAATMAIVPATMKASAGAKMLTASLAGLLTYGAAAYGIFKMLNGAMSGIGTTTGGNILPDNYTAAMDKYQVAMDEYNAKIAQYQEAYNTPYTAITDGSSSAIDSLNAVADASSDAASSVKNDWTAAFDEVYTIPNIAGGGGGAGSAAEALFPDFGELLSLPAFSFPGIGDEELKAPEFPWSDVLGDGLLDSDVLDGDWWKSLLPFVIAGGAIQLGKIFAAANKPVVSGLDEAMKSTKEAILATREAQKEALLSVSRDFDEISELLTKTISELHNPRLRGEERALLERNLDKLITAGEKTVVKLNDVQDALLLTGKARRSTAIVDQAKQQDAIIKIEHTLDSVEKLQGRLVDMTFAQTAAGHAAIQELKQLKDTAVKQYVAYAGKYGSDAAFEQIASDLGISMPNLNSGVDTLKKNLGDLVNIAEGGFKESEKAQQLIKEARNILKVISEDAAIIGVHVEGIDKLQSQFKLLSDGLKASGDATVNKELLLAVRNVLNNREALEELKLMRSSTVAKLEDMSIKYAENTISSRQLADAISDIAITFDEVRFSVATLRQSQIAANKAYASTLNKIVSRQLPSIMATMAKVDRYGAEIMRNAVEGKNAIIGMQKKIDVAIGSIESGTEQLRGPLEAMKETADMLLNSNAKTAKLVQKHYNEVVDAIVEIGKSSGAEGVAIDKAIDAFSDAVEDGISKATVESIEQIIKQVGATAAPGNAIQQDSFLHAADELHSKLLLSAHSAEDFANKLDEGIHKLATSMAIKEGVDPLDFVDRYTTQIDEVLNNAAESYRMQANSTSLITDYVTSEQFNKAVERVGIDLANIPTAQADKIGNAIRTEATHLLEQLEATNSDEWKNFVRIIRDGGVFDISKALATGGNFGALKLGQTSFGNTGYSVMVDNLKQGLLRDMFPTNTASATNLKSATIGIESEEMSKRLLADYLLASNRMLYKTSTYVDETRKVIVQLDAAVGSMLQAEYPIDVKVLSDSSYAKLVKSMEALGTTTDGTTVKLTEQAFEELLRVMPDYALQIAAQAHTLGTSTAALAVFNHETAGLTKTMKNVAKLDVTTKQGKAQLTSAVREAIVAGITDSEVLNSFKGSLRVLEFSIPDSAKQEVVRLADDLRAAEIAISKFASSGATTEDLVYALSNKLATGEDVGMAGVYRYIGKNFTWQNKSIAAVTQAVGRIEPLLKSGNASLTEIGMSRLAQIQDALKATVNRGSIGAGELIEGVIPSMRETGSIATFTATAEEILDTVKSLDTYSKVMTGYQYAMVTQFNDAIRQLNEYAARGKRMTDIAYTTMKNGQETATLIADIAQRAAHNAKTLERLYNVTDNKVSKQLRQMIEQGTVGTIDNPFQIATADQIARLVDTYEKGIASAVKAPIVQGPEVLAVVEQTDDKVNRVVDALSSGSRNLSETADMLKQGSKAFSDAVKEADTATKAAATANNTTAQISYKAAVKSTEAAEALKAAGEKLERLDVDELQKAFNAIQFDPTKRYPSTNPEDLTGTIRNLPGERLAAAQGKSNNAFLNFSIQDELGQLLYSPEMHKASDALMDFFESLDAMSYTGADRLYSSVDFSDILKANISAMSEVIKAGKISKVSKTLTNEITAALSSLDLGDGIGDAVKAASKQIAKSMYSTGEVTAQEIIMRGKSVAGEMGKQLSGGDDATARAIAKAINSVVTNNAANFSKVYSSAADISKELADGIDKFYSSTGLSDEAFEEASKAISGAYKSLGDELVKNIVILTDGDVAAKNLAKVSGYLDDVIDSGLGLAAEDVATYLSRATKMLGHKTNKVYADEISYAVDETLKTTTDDIAAALKSLTPQIRLSDEAVDLASEGASAMAQARNAAPVAKSGVSASDIILGGTAGVGVIDAVALGLDAYFANKESTAMAGNLDQYMSAYSKNDTVLAGALGKLQANNVELNSLASNGSNWFTAMFGGADLSNAAWESVGANVGITAGQAAGATITAMLADAAGYSAAGPAGIAAAVIGGGGSLAYGLTGGNSVGNKYTDAYLSAREQDTIYKNAVEAGLTAAEARSVSDAALKMYRETVFTDLDKSMWKVDDFNKVLYGETSKRSNAAGKLKGSTEEAIANRMLRLEQALGKVPAYGDDYNKLVADSRAQGLSGTLYETDNLNGMIDVLDYIFKEGNYSSEIAKDFFENFGEQEMEYLRSTEYGEYMEAYDNAQEFVDMLNELGGTNIDLAQLINENKLGSVIQAIIDFKTDFDSSFKNKLDVFKEVTGAEGNGFGDNAFVKREAQWISSDADKSDDTVGNEYISAFTGMNKEVLDKLKEEYGILVDSTVKEFQNTSGDTVKELYSAVSIDYNKLRDDITGWTLKLPDTISLSGASLSATDIEILAQAGIQINGDGTVTFTKAMNSNTTGTNRDIKLSDDMVSSSFEAKTATVGVKLDFSEAEASLDLDIDKLSSHMSSALFRLSTAITGGVSTEAANAIAGLGKVLDSGYIEITDKSVLSGQKTVQQYFEGMGYKFDEAGRNIEQSGQTVSEQVVNAFTNIDKVVAQEGSRSAQAVANWADGIVVKAPFESDELTAEIETAYAAAGAKFVESSNGLMMVINHAGENLKDGVTVIPEELWNKLNNGVKEGLHKLGVTWDTEAGFVKVDISNTLGSLVTTDDIEPVRTALEGIGIAFETTGNRITGIVDENGNRIENGLLKIPNSIWDKVTPETKKALENLGVNITTEGGNAMLDMNSIISDGIDNVVALFTEQPDFWNQIPDAVKQTLVDAGIATQEGMLVVNRYMLEGLMPVESGWAGFWENMPQDTRKAFTEAGIATDSGLFKIEESLDGTTIPEGVDGIIMKFDELPPSLQEAIIASGAAISEKGYLVYNATADVVNNVTEAINANKQNAIAAANNMATQIEQSVTSALSNIQRLQNIDVGRQYGVVGKKNTTSDMKYIHNSKGDVTLRYVIEYNNDGKFVQFHWWDPVTGAEKSGKSLPRLAEGGLGSGTTLVGELGRELAILPDGSMQMLGKNNGELVDLPNGTRVLNNQDTEDVMKYTNNLSGVASVRKLADGNATVTVSGADSLYKVLDVMYNLPSEIADAVRSAIGIKNAGVADGREAVRERDAADKPVVTTELINAAATAIADKLYEVIAPVVATKSDNTQALRPLLVGTLIGDERSMRELSKKLMVIEQEENSRRGGR